MDARTAIRECGKNLIEQGLTWGNSGNISARIGEEDFLITAGGTSLGTLQDEDIVRCRINDDSYSGERSPSMETGLHREIYRACPDARAVIHSQPLYSTIAACSNIIIRTDFLPEAMAYLDNIQRVPYHHAGSRELAEATAALAGDSQVLLLANHGVVCWAGSLKEALIITRTLEFCCQLLIVSRGSGLDFNYLGEDTIADFRKHLGNIGR